MRIAGMRRREFLLGAGAGIAAASPSRAQPSARPQVGVLFPGGPAALELRMPPFRDGVFSAAAAVNPDIEIVSRVAAGDPGRLPALATELVGMGVRAILAVSPAAVRAARNATATIPIVAHDLESDPIANGWAASIARPGGNITGLFLDLPDISVKCLQLLQEVVPGQKVGIPVGPGDRLAAARGREGRGCATRRRRRDRRDAQRRRARRHLPQAEPRPYRRG